MRRIGLGSLVLACMLGCVSTKLDVTRPLSGPVREVSLSVAPVTPELMSDLERSRLRTALTSSLIASGISVVPTDQSGAAGLIGVIVTYDPGERWKRAVIGYGYGTGTFRSRWRVVSAAGAVVGECAIEGRVTGGAFGGSYDEVIEKVGVDLRDCLLGGGSKP
jgi:hypothetical protein